MTAGAGASARAASMDIPAVQVDGNDVLAVHAAAATLVREVRAGAGPRLLHALTYRVKGHVSVDPAAYRDPDELKAALATDPIARARRHYLALPGAQARPCSTPSSARPPRKWPPPWQPPTPRAWPDAAAAYTDVQTTGAGQWR